MKKIAVLLNSELIEFYPSKLLSLLEGVEGAEITYIFKKTEIIGSKHKFSSLVKNWLLSIEDYVFTKLGKRAHFLKLEGKYFFGKENSILQYEHDDGLSALLGSKFDLLINLDRSNVDNIEFLSLFNDGCLTVMPLLNIKSNFSGFYEVFTRSSATSFFIEHFFVENNVIENRLVFYGEQPTSPLFSLNKSSLIELASRYLVKCVTSYVVCDHISNQASANTLIRKKQSNDPSIWQVLLYYFVAFLNLLSFVKAKIKSDCFAICYAETDWENIDFSKGCKIENPAGHYLADPFVVQRDDRTVCYAESYSFSDKKGKLIAVELLGNGQYKHLGDVIEEAFHLSFPHAFEYNGSLYMVPESSQAGSIRLYKCIDFPMVWEYQYDLMNGCQASDTLIFKHHNKWWMLTNMSDYHPSQMNTNLCVFYSDSPLSNDWQAHKLNPIIMSCSHGRNGGLAFMSDGLPVRIRQKYGFLSYGVGFSAAKITKLNTNEYVEQEILNVEPDFFNNISGCHHMHSSGLFTVFDYKK